MNFCRETVEMDVIPGNRRELDSVLEQYVAGSDTRGRPEGRSDTRSQQAIHEICGLGYMCPLLAAQQIIIKNCTLRPPLEQPH
jgi:hypothetical protein